MLSLVSIMSLFYNINQLTYSDETNDNKNPKGEILEINIFVLRP